MFITCQECNTTYRLDERLLKPTGSKVRCSQCGHIFVGHPPAAPDVAEPVVPEPSVSATVPPPADEPPEEQELEGIDLAELDAILEKGSPFAEEGDTAETLETTGDKTEADKLLDELDEADLDFDFEAALEPEDDAAAPEMPTAPEEIDEIDLDMDFEIHDDDILVSEQEAAQVPDMEELPRADEPGVEETDTSSTLGTIDEDSAFGDLELDIDDAAVPSDEQPVETGSAQDDLDLLDLDFDLEEEDARPETITEEPELSLDDDSELELEDDAQKETDTEGLKEGPGEDELELELDLELDDSREPEPEPVPESIIGQVDERPETEGQGPDDELDLSDLDALMATTGEPDGDKAEHGGDTDLVLDLEEDAPAAASSSAEAPEEELEDLEFSLDAEFDDKTEEQRARAGDTIAEEDEVDLSDIEQMLGGDAEAAEKAPKMVEPVEEQFGLGDEDEIDLAEIESAIEAADKLPDTKAEGDTLDDLDLELDLDFEALDREKEKIDKEQAPEAESMDLELDLEMEDKPDTMVEPDEEEELDLSDLGELVMEKEERTETEVIHSGDIELEFHIDEDDDARAEPKSVPKQKPARAPEPISSQLDDKLEAEEKRPPAPKPFKTKKKTSKSLVVLLILVLLGGGGYGLYHAVIERGIEIPYVGDYVKQAADYFMPGPQDPHGIMNLSTMDISSKFIENAESGRLFVITGRVRNGYSTPREMIRVQGQLYTRGKVLAQTEYSYAGLLVGDQDLANRPVEEIGQILKAVSQDRIAATTVQPGQNLSFMLVFSELPPADQLDEFAIELVSAAPAR